jgi:asparagine synthase (glutamine-hydrolysing)
MSGIAGVYCLDQTPVNPADVDLMIRSLAVRGPDGSGKWVQASVGLAHLRFHTTPEARAERQPLTSERGDICLTADARIDNRAELRAALLGRDVTLRDDSDAELILRSYEVWGEACPVRIVGDFAFALWDGRKRQLLCARDPVGIRPFFYTFDGRTFRWASTARALFTGGRPRPEVNRALLGMYLLARVEEAEETLEVGVYRLPGSHNLVVSQRGLHKARYWDVDPHHRIAYRSDRDYAEHFLHLFRAAVRASLRSSGPVGTLLSGGLDSSAIACTAKLLEREGLDRGGEVMAFALQFRERAADEARYQNEVIQACKMPVVAASFEDHLGSVDFERAADYPDGYYAFSILFMEPLCQAARLRGVRVLLDGIGGDDLLAMSFAHLTDLLAQGRFGDWLRQFRHDVRHSQWPLWRIARTHCLSPFVPRPLKDAANAVLKPYLGERLAPWIDVEGFRQAGVLDRLPQRIKPHGFPTLAQEAIYQALAHGWNAMIALPAVDAFATVQGLEFRHPFFYRPLIEFLLAVPEEQRWRGPWRKWILRKALDLVLPPGVKGRKDKAHFSLTRDRDWTGRQAEKIKKLLRNSLLAQWHLVLPERLIQGWEQYQKSGGKELDSAALGRIIWLELWAQTRLGQLNTERASDERTGDLFTTR